LKLLLSEPSTPPFMRRYYVRTTVKVSWLAALCWFPPSQAVPSGNWKPLPAYSGATVQAYTWFPLTLRLGKDTLHSIY